METKLPLAEIRRPVGRPRFGESKIIYYRRIPKDMKDKLDAILKSNGDAFSETCKFVETKENESIIVKGIVAESTPTSHAQSNGRLEYWIERSQESDANVRRLLDDVDRLTRELDEEKAKVKRALEMDLDEKGKMGWRLYFKLKEGSGKSDYDQT